MKASYRESLLKTVKKKISFQTLIQTWIEKQNWVKLAAFTLKNKIVKEEK